MSFIDLTVCSSLRMEGLSGLLTTVCFHPVFSCGYFLLLQVTVVGCWLSSGAFAGSHLYFIVFRGLFFWFPVFLHWLSLRVLCFIIEWPCSSLAYSLFYLADAVMVLFELLVSFAVVRFFGAYRWPSVWYWLFGDAKPILQACSCFHALLGEYSQVQMVVGCSSSTCSVLSGSSRQFRFSNGLRCPDLALGGANFCTFCDECCLQFSFCPASLLLYCLWLVWFHPLVVVRPMHVAGLGLFVVLSTPVGRALP